MRLQIQQVTHSYEREQNIPPMLILPQFKNIHSKGIDRKLFICILVTEMNPGVAKGDAGTDMEMAALLQRVAIFV